MNFIKNDGTPMTVAELRERHPDGKCHLCGTAGQWEAGAAADEGELLYYFIRCTHCGTEYPEDI